MLIPVGKDLVKAEVKEQLSSFNAGMTQATITWTCAMIRTTEEARPVYGVESGRKDLEEWLTIMDGAKTGKDMGLSKTTDDNNF
tara:strand:+ start:262 stop:513 length:252 start_codon:yes stop_codon:yes gene_type:complete